MLLFLSLSALIFAVIDPLWATSTWSLGSAPQYLYGAAVPCIPFGQEDVIEFKESGRLQMDLVKEMSNEGKGDDGLYYTTNIFEVQNHKGYKNLWFRANVTSVEGQVTYNASIVGLDSTAPQKKFVFFFDHSNAKEYNNHAPEPPAAAFYLSNFDSCQTPKANDLRIIADKVTIYEY